MTEWRLKCEAVEKRESERREVDAKKHREEVTFLENHGEEMNFCLVPARKCAAILLSGGFHAGSCPVAPVLKACAGSVPASDFVFYCAAKQLKQQLETLLAPKK